MNDANTPPSSPFVSNILTAVEYFIAFCFYAFSLQYVLRILFQLFSRSKHLLISQDKHGLSKLLISNLVCWAILMGSALPHIAWMLAHWRPEGRSMNPYTIFWTTIVTECLMAMIPYSLFFLTLDRIFAIQLLNAYQDRQSRLVLIGCVFTLLLVFAINLFAFCQIMPLPPTTECNVFACLMTNGNTTFIASKLFGGVTIIFAGGYFLTKLRKRQAMIRTNMQMNPPPKLSSKIEPDSLVILMICTELGLNFLPQLMIFIIQTLLGHQIATEIGPINHFLNCIDALISTLTYVHTLRRFLHIHSNSQTRTNNGTGGGGGGQGAAGGAAGGASQSVPRYKFRDRLSAMLQQI